MIEVVFALPGVPMTSTRGSDEKARPPDEREAASCAFAAAAVVSISSGAEASAARSRGVR
jgi:hypothetical protein